jgi:hypothetical protein
VEFMEFLADKCGGSTTEDPVFGGIGEPATGSAADKGSVEVKEGDTTLEVGCRDRGRKEFEKGRRHGE